MRSKRSSLSPYPKLVYIPLSGELLIHTSYWRSDRIGVLLLDALLSSASRRLVDPASLPWGTEADRLAPSIEAASAIPPDSTPALRERGAAAVSTFSDTAGAFGIYFKGTVDAIPKGTGSAASVLDPATSKKVIVTRKEKVATSRRQLRTGQNASTTRLRRGPICPSLPRRLPTPQDYILVQSRSLLDFEIE